MTKPIPDIKRILSDKARALMGHLPVDGSWVWRSDVITKSTLPRQSFTSVEISLLRKNLIEQRFNHRDPASLGRLQLRITAAGVTAYVESSPANSGRGRSAGRSHSHVT